MNCVITWRKDFRTEILVVQFNTRLLSIHYVLGAVLSVEIQLWLIHRLRSSWSGGQAFSMRAPSKQGLIFPLLSLNVPCTQRYTLPIFTSIVLIGSFPHPIHSLGIVEWWGGLGYKSLASQPSILLDLSPPGIGKSFLSNLSTFPPSAPSLLSAES